MITLGAELEKRGVVTAELAKTWKLISWASQSTISFRNSILHSNAVLFMYRPVVVKSHLFLHEAWQVTSDEFLNPLP